MFEYINYLDKEITLFINSLSGDTLDIFMIFFSNKYVWIPLYLFIIYKLYLSNNKRYLVHVSVCIIAVLISDFITSSLMKPFFERLRPCHIKDLQGVIDIVSGCGGKFGFASSHASSTFSLATIVFLISDKKVKYLFFWSLVIGYSRIYLGVHFFSDVIVGFIVGALTSYVLYRILNSKL